MRREGHTEEVRGKRGAGGKEVRSLARQGSARPWLLSERTVTGVMSLPCGLELPWTPFTTRNRS